MLRRAYCTRQERRAGKNEMLSSPALNTHTLHGRCVCMAGGVYSPQAESFLGRLGTSHHDYKTGLTSDQHNHFARCFGLRLSGELRCASPL